MLNPMRVGLHVPHFNSIESYRIKALQSTRDYRQRGYKRLLKKTRDETPDIKIVSNVQKRGEGMDKQKKKKFIIFTLTCVAWGTATLAAVGG